MNFRKDKNGREPVAINLTSLIDVVLLLLIFFMISTTFVLSPGLKVDLPESSVEEITQEKDDIIIVVTDDNRILIGEKTYDSDTLFEELKMRKEKTPDANLIIQADEYANHGSVVIVMDSAKKTGFTKLSISTRRKE